MKDSYNELFYNYFLTKLYDISLSRIVQTVILYEFLKF